MATAFDSTTLLQHKLILGILGTLICMGIMVKIVFHIELNSKPKRKRDKKRRMDKIIENNLSELTLSASITKSGSRDGDDDNSTSQQSYNKKEQVINFPTNFPPGLSDDVQIHTRSDSFDDDESVVSYTSMKDDCGVRQTSTYRRKRLSFMDKLGTCFYISLLTFLNYLLLVYLPAGIGFSMTGMVLTTVVVLKSHIADEIRRKRMDRIAALFALMFFTASFLSLARFATEGLYEGEIYEGPARIVGYDQERYGDVVGGGTLRMDLVVQFGGEWACPANPSNQCQAEVSGALCQQSENDVIAKQGPSIRRYLSDQKDGRKLEDLSEYINELDGEEEAENEELLKDEENGVDDAIIAVEEVLVDELDEEITDMSIEEEKNAEIESIDQEKVVVEEQLLNDNDKEAVEIAFDTEEDTVEKDYNDFEESVNEEYDEAIESLEGEEVNGTSSQEEEEIEDLKDELDYYVEKSKEEEEDNQKLAEDYVSEYYTKEDLENELVKEEVKAENMTENQAYLDVINKTATYENEEKKFVKSYYNDDNFEQNADETYEDEAYYAIENLFFDDDFFADEYWNYGWDSVWGDYACSDLFDNDLQGKAFDADEAPGGDDWPFINVYGTCNSCKAFLVDYYTQEHFDQIRQYQVHAVHYFIMGFVASLFYAALALKQWIAPSEENKVTLLMAEAEIA